MKLQNYFKDFLPKRYLDFRRSMPTMTAKQAVVAELLRECCEGDQVKAIKLMFERVLGKPERPVIVKGVTIRCLYPEAEGKSSSSSGDGQPSYVKPYSDGKVCVGSADSPGHILRSQLDAVGDKGRQYAYQVLDNKDSHTVAEVVAANLYAIAMGGSSIGAVDILFDYLDGAVADVIRVASQSVIEVEDYSQLAPSTAMRGSDGVYYTDTMLGV